MFQHILVVKIKEGALDSIIKAANIAAEATRKEPGNIFYNLLQPVEAADTVIFVEGWENESDFLVHVNGAACQKFGETMDPAVAGVPQAYACRVLA
ncbi:antibiotic biosynthesis monooxygenase [Dehalobacter sp. DCM]|uniref:putative quinol monooxygenase n=1 Tax=Dehalobacter sp. DCM TaxID=2907827 RepID=UPI0030820B86|nr:antibiotic biosynthesis monooxygenase [Dehalobacter sp. DCM]